MSRCAAANPERRLSAFKTEGPGATRSTQPHAASVLHAWRESDHGEEDGWPLTKSTSRRRGRVRPAASFVPRAGGRSMRKRRSRRLLGDEAAGLRELALGVPGLSDEGEGDLDRRVDFLLAGLDQQVARCGGSGDDLAGASGKRSGLGLREPDQSSKARADAFRVGLSFALAVCGSLTRRVEPDRILGCDLPPRAIDACVELCRGSGHEAADQAYVGET